MVYEGSLFPTLSPAFIVCIFFDDGHSDQHEMIIHCDFDLHFSNNGRYRASFHVFISHLHGLFGVLFCFFKNYLFSSFPHFLTGLFFGSELCELFISFLN